MPDTHPQFEALKAHATQTGYLLSSAALLEWDQQTKLPSSGGQYRSEQITYLAKLIHERETDSQLGDLLHELSESQDVLGAAPASDIATTVRELKRKYERQVKVPSDLAQALAGASSKGQQIWVSARHENDFSLFQPALEQIINLKQQQADAIGFDDCRYDALLEEYEPGGSTREVNSVFDDLSAELVPLLEQLKGCGQQVDSSVLHRVFPVAAQEAFVKQASAKIGFDYKRGRLDTTHHPFCTEIGPDDCRITTRYNETFFSSAFFGTLHEAGHGMYEQGLRGDWYGLPPGQYCSLGIHESQSRLWENLVGRSEDFWKYFFPTAQDAFSDALSDISVDHFHRAINEITPSLIRVEADEVTYNLHIIIRFELERSLIDGDLAVADLPEAWNEKYQRALGITPPDDASGVLQDVHWSAGLIGYFPTYSLGNLYASQFFDAANTQIGGLGELFAKGDFTPLKTWLNENIHQRGKCLPPKELCREITGEELSHKSLIKHLKSKIVRTYGPTA
jgi:carboxypeptidase Taq